MLTTCKVCGEADLMPLWPDADGEGDRLWARCLVCGSDSADRTYPEVRPLYTASYIDRETSEVGGSIDACIAAMRSNLEWFDTFQGKAPGRHFLDVGCCNGAALQAMRERRWSVHGFDVIRPPYFGDHVTVAEHFTATLFRRRFSAVLCREVIEHVDNWLDMLQQLHAVTEHNGLIQIQTPRPCREPHPIPYQQYHLQLISPFVLRSWIEKLGVEILDFKIWGIGSAFIGQRFN